MSSNLTIEQKSGKASSRLRVFSELIKARLTLMVLVTTTMGFYLATNAMDWLLLFRALFGTGLLACGAAALNQYLEKDLDAKMQRTASRPIPVGQIAPETALLLGGALSAAGLVYIASQVNLLTSVIGAVTLVSYIAVYTPLKRVTPINTVVGAVPGALPPLMGWTAAGGEITEKGLALVAILYFWQLPHFFAIAWIYREEYAKAGFVMLSLDDESGERTSQQAVAYAVCLLPFSILPYAFGMAGAVYFAGAIILGGLYLAFAISFYRKLSIASARRLFIYSIVYLPLLLGLIFLDRT
jgi:protoheme IX farnesyltransferase|tara:strand:+ start:3357 stop:4250 length:894 start_codon:yes stop_codon:yes gene_type:complete